MSIKQKLTLALMGISIGAVMLTVLAIVTYLIYDMRIGKAHELEVMAATTGDRNSAALLFLDDERARKNLELFRLTPSILLACVYNTQKSLFAEYHIDDHTCPAHAGEWPEKQADMLSAVSAIVDNGNAVGTVYLVSDTRDIDAYVRKILFISGTATALVLLGTVMLAVHFQHTISAPILRLAETAQIITMSRDYTLSADEGDMDETGKLARAFNAMLAEVRKRDRELVEANETLEHKVIERTQELERAKTRAEAASAAKTEFLRNMSHELRTPLHALVSFSSYGIREHDTAERGQLRKYFEMIQIGANRLSKLVDEVLDLARLEHGEHVFSLKRADMRDIVSRAAELIQPLLQEKKLQLTLDAEDGVMETICDQDKIFQVVTNLLGNAVKFSSPDHTITIALRGGALDEKRALAVSVIDEGVGIPEGEEEVIFESFRQSSRTNTGAGGTGLGLSICRRIMEAHGGRIWAENNQGKPGARVTFAIPALLEEGRKVVRLQEKEA